MLKLEQLEVLVGATIAMLDENLAEVDDPEVKEQIEEEKERMVKMFNEIKFARFMELMREEVMVEP